MLKALLLSTLVLAGTAFGAESFRVTDEISVELDKAVYAPGETVTIKAVYGDGAPSLELIYGWVRGIESSDSVFSTLDADTRDLKIELPADAAEGRYFVGLLQFMSGVDDEGRIVGPRYFDVVNDGAIVGEDDTHELTPIYFEVRN